MSLRRGSGLALLATLLLACWCVPAGAQDSVAPTRYTPDSQTVAPRGFRLSAREAIRVAQTTPQARKELHAGGGVRVEALISGAGAWEVNLWRGDDNVAEVDVDGVSGRVLAVHEGFAAANYLARGHLGAHADSWWLWALMCVLFVAPFVDPRRPLRILHLDLAALLAFGVSHIFFTRGNVEVSVPLVYPVLGYLLVRMLVVGLGRRRRDDGPLVPFAPTWLLLAGIGALAGLRIGVDLWNAHKVLDVGYASVVGADRIVHGQELYTLNETHGDTYGPVTYLSYIPFEALLPWKGAWDAVPAAHAAAIVFDLLTMLLLGLLGMRLRGGAAGRRLGAALAFAWAAFPYSMYAMATNTNDGLVALLIVASLLAWRSRAGRGTLLGLATAAKFAPAVLLGVLARGERPSRSAIAWTLVSFAAVVVAAFAGFVPEGGLRDLWDTTLGYQLGRASAFSPWGQDPALHWLQTALKAGALVVVAVAVLWPGPRDLRRISALGAASLIAIQIPATHWFYFYVAWFAPLVFVALFAGRRTATDPQPDPELDATTWRRPATPWSPSPRSDALSG